MQASLFVRPVFFQEFIKPVKGFVQTACGPYASAIPGTFAVHRHDRSHTPEPWRNSSFYDNFSFGLCRYRYEYTHSSRIVPIGCTRPFVYGTRFKHAYSINVRAVLKPLFDTRRWPSARRIRENIVPRLSWA